MKILYFECNMGAAGDMLLSALTDLMPDEKIDNNKISSDNGNNTSPLISKEKFIEQLNNAGIPGVKYTLTRSQKCGIYGTKVVVTVDGEEEESVDIGDGSHIHEHDCDCEHDHDHHHDHDCGCGHDHEHHYHDHDCGCGQDHEHHHHDHECGSEHDHEHNHHDHGHTHTHTHAHTHTHSHSGLDDIAEIIENLRLPSMVKMDAVAVYNIIAEAESVAHNCSIKEIHFHEVGTMDAIADIVGVCLALYRIKPEQVLCSPIHVGSGQVRCAHGILPVPAPATAYILKQIPIYGGQIKGELCTPTGAALLKYFVEKYNNLPNMTINQIGIGCGTKDFEQANIVRVLLGDEYTSNSSDKLIKTDKVQYCSNDNSCLSNDINNVMSSAPSNTIDMIYELSCNIDDMTGEEIAFATEKLLEAGALDVYTISIGMKKNRPGVMLNCICKPETKELFAKLIFRYTTTLGIREKEMSRYILNREFKDMPTEYGNIKLKRSFGYDSEVEKIEFSDLEKIANELKLRPETVKKNIYRNQI